MLRHLNLAEMLGLIATWVLDAERRALFLSIPEIAGLHPKCVTLHAELLAAQPAATGLPPALRKLLADATAADGRHDALARAVAVRIDAERAYCLAARPPEPQRAEQAAEVSRALFPDGLSIVNASLLAESANTARVAERLTQAPALADYLDTLPVREGVTLLDLTRRWIATGKQLGKLERRREVLEAKETTKAAGPATINALRARWLKLVSGVLSNLELCEASDEAVETIRGPVRKASDRAGQRYATPMAKPEPTHTPEPTPTPPRTPAQPLDLTA